MEPATKQDLKDLLKEFRESIKEAVAEAFGNSKPALEHATTLAASQLLSTDAPASPTTIVDVVPVLAASAASAKPLDIDATGVIPPTTTTCSTECPSRDATASTPVFTLGTTPTSATATIDVTPVLAASMVTNDFTTPSRLLQAAAPALIHELKRPAAADRLHLDVGHRWPTQFDQPFLPANHQSSAWPGFPAQLMQGGGNCSEKDRKYFSDSDPRSTSDVGDDTENYWCSEEESDGHAASGRDINQYFGGGVMYWSPAEHAGTGFSRPPSLSSDDSAWSWHEADVSRVVDDLAVGIPSSTYHPNGASSPPSSPFCSQNETSDPSPQPACHSVAGNDIDNEASHSLLLKGTIGVISGERTLLLAEIFADISTRQQQKSVKLWKFQQWDPGNIVHTRIFSGRGNLEMGWQYEQRHIQCWNLLVRWTMSLEERVSLNPWAPLLY